MDEGPVARHGQQTLDPVLDRDALTGDSGPHIREMDRDEARINSPASRGTWQGVYLWEHRTAPHHTRVTVSVVG
jgi:hypothetical protein